MTGSAFAAWASLWLAVVGGLAWAARPRLIPLDRLGAGVDPDNLDVRRQLLGHRWHAVTASLGGAMRRLGRRPANVNLDRRLGAATIAAMTTVPVDPRLAMIVGLLTWMRPIRAERRATQRRHHLVLQELPEVVDLLSVAVRGGLTVPLAVAAVGERLDGEVALALRQCVEEAALGQRLSETARRRNAEIAARRVPIKLLFPLVFCVLPSFALLTVVPVLAGSLKSFGL